MRKLAGKVKRALLRCQRSVFEWMGSDRYSHFALDDLDRKLSKYLDFSGGTFIECGANNGMLYSNTYWFERFRGWRGILIEAIPEMAAECRRNRPRAKVVNAALVANADVESVRIRAAGLMAYVSGSFSNAAQEQTHLRTAMEVQNLTSVPEIEVPARTLSRIIDELKVGQIDFFSLDVEGFEAEVLKGLDLSRHRPTYILVETKQIGTILEILDGAYEQVDILSHHDYLLRTVSK